MTRRLTTLGRFDGARAIATIGRFEANEQAQNTQLFLKPQATTEAITLRAFTVKG